MLEEGFYGTAGFALFFGSGTGVEYHKSGGIASCDAAHPLPAADAAGGGIGR